ncbi:MAG: hypothetical protein RL318_3009 [Fibrobacterota bacterium]|jgi:hypothetical protein
MHILAAGLSGLLLLPGCGNDRIAGSTTETENILTGVVFSVDSLLAEQSPFKRPPMVVTLRLDSSIVDFKKTDSLGRDLVVEQIDSTPLPFSIVYWDKKVTLGRIHVRLDSSQMLSGSKIRLRWKAPLLNRGNAATVWQGVPDFKVLALNSVLVDDFERATTRSPLPDSASWYSVATDSATVSIPKLDTAGLGRTGHAIRIGYNAPSINYQYSLLGIALGTSPVNLHSLDSMVVWVRGTGKLSIAFDRLIPGSLGKAWLHRTLTSGWTRIRIRPQDFDSASTVGNNIGWEAVRNSVTNLTFLVSGGSDLWVDDVRLYGIDKNDLQ